MKIMLYFSSIILKEYSTVYINCDVAEAIMIIYPCTVFGGFLFIVLFVHGL